MPKHSVYECPFCKFFFNQENIEQVMMNGQCPECQKIIGKDAKEAKEIAADMHFQMLTVLVRNFYFFGPIGLGIIFIVSIFLITKPFFDKIQSIFEIISLIVPGLIGIISGHFVSKRVIRAWAIKKNQRLRKQYGIELISYKNYLDLY